MNNNLLKIYHSLPPTFRDIVATMRGYYLRSWRYGPETERLVEEALERDRWSPEQWKVYQEERLSFILHRAATQVPYYRDLWQKHRRNGYKASWDYLENWPILEKEQLRANPEAFVADDCNIKNMYHEHTSGTTGTSLDLWWSCDTVRRWFALFEARWRQWNGVSRYDRWAILGGQLVTPLHQKKPPFWVWNRALNQLYMSSYHLSTNLIPHYIEALRKYRIRYIYSYTSSIHTLAQEVLHNNLINWDIKVIITNAEPIYEYQRDNIASAFRCPVRETYGMSEIVTAAGECEAGGLHLWPEVGITEVLEDVKPVITGEVGDLICTGLINLDMPLIRYRVGDRGALSTETTLCKCGRTLPRLNKVNGRIDDILYTPDGRQIGRLDPVFKTNLPVREAQIIQETLTRIRVRYVPTPEFNSEAQKSIDKRLRERVGDVEIIFDPVSEIPRTPAGKFRAVICNLSPEERTKVQ
jgi:phenylacetate-CoA ligase